MALFFSSLFIGFSPISFWKIIDSGKNEGTLLASYTMSGNVQQFLMAHLPKN